MDCATMRSDVIGDFQEPYGAVLGMLHLHHPQMSRRRSPSGYRASPRVIDKSYRPDCLKPDSAPALIDMRPSHGAQGKETTMAWTTPTLVEICLGLEINGYLP